MSDEVALTSRIERVARLIDLYARRGDGSGLASLRRRARSLLDPPASPRSERARVQAAIDVEASIWVEALHDFLLPESRALVVEAFREHPVDRGSLRGFDPWSMVDDRVRRASDLDRAEETLRAVHAAAVSCQEYQRTRRTRYLRDAVSYLESATEVSRRPVCRGVLAEDCRQHADRLKGALSAVLPASVFCFLVEGVRGLVESKLAAAGVARLSSASEPDQWLSREEWTTESRRVERSVGAWFVTEAQQDYESEMERQRLEEEAERRRRTEADARYRRWQEERDEEAKGRGSASPEEPTAVSEPADPESSIERSKKGIFIPVLTGAPEFDYRDNVAWPAHVERNERYRAEVIQRNEADHAEYVQAQQLQRSKEAERSRAEAAMKAAEDAFKAKAALKASPARIQSTQ
jgi:hypothetical protein